jgi:transcription elongation factor Elf1
MLLNFECDFCDNKDKSLVYEYDGCLGYEALVCRKCGVYYDYQKTGYYEPDEWSKQFTIKEKREVKL